MKRAVFAPLLALCLAGCAGLTSNWTSTAEPMSAEQAERAQILKDIDQVKYIKFSPDAPDVVNPSTQPDKIAIFSGKPDQKYVEIGSIAIQNNEEFDYLTKILRTKASLIGADAIINYQMTSVAVKNKGSGFVNGNSITQSNKIKYQQLAQGIAIRFKK